MKLQSPDGVDIIGTVEKIPYATAIIINEGVTVDSEKPEGRRYQFDYEGTTEINWDSQVTLHDENGQALYEDELGREWPENQLRLVKESTPSKSEAEIEALVASSRK